MTWLLGLGQKPFTSKVIGDFAVVFSTGPSQLWPKKGCSSDANSASKDLSGTSGPRTSIPSVLRVLHSRWTPTVATYRR